MEIKATLNKPYTEQQRMDFIVVQNHQNNRTIKETESALEAWGLTAEEASAKEKEAQRVALLSQLDALDLKCIRALRAIQAGTGTQADSDKLAELEEQAGDIRQQLKDLED